MYIMYTMYIMSPQPTNQPTHQQVLNAATSLTDFPHLALALHGPHHSSKVHLATQMPCSEVPSFSRGNMTQMRTVRC